MKNEIKDYVLSAVEQILYTGNRKDKPVVLKLYLGDIIEYYADSNIVNDLCNSTSGALIKSNILVDAKLHSSYRVYAGIQQQYNELRKDKIGFKIDLDVEQEVLKILETSAMLFSYEVVLHKNEINNVSNAQTPLGKYCKLHSYVSTMGIKERDANGIWPDVWSMELGLWTVKAEESSGGYDNYIKVYLDGVTIIDAYWCNDTLDIRTCKDKECINALLLYCT